MQLIPVDHTITKPVEGKKLYDQNYREMMHIKLQAGEVVKEHDSPKHVYIFVKSGEVEFTVSGETHLISADRVLYMEPYERHSLKAVSDVSILVMKC